MLGWIGMAIALESGFLGTQVCHLLKFVSVKLQLGLPPAQVPHVYPVLAALLTQMSLLQAT